MKKLISIVVISLIAFGARAQQASPKDESKTESMSQMKKDYFFWQDGKMMVEKKGEKVEMTDASVHLTDGTTLKNDGSIERPDGKVVMLKKDQYINIDGKVGKMKMK